MFKWMMIFSALVIAGMQLSLFVAFGAELDGMSADRLEMISQGGRIYDNWWRQLSLPEKPRSTHPSYPKIGKKKGYTTWRCVECHGWDHKGNRGEHGKGVHYTGIMGIRNVVGSSEQEIINILKDQTHQFGDVIPKTGLISLAAFVVHGQMEMDEYIDRASKKAKGDVNKGSRIFQTICARCHGIDGKLMNFGDENNPEYIGTIASKNPWQTLHKIRNGQPGLFMPSMLAFPMQSQVDILAYCQTLPKE